MKKILIPGLVFSAFIILMYLLMLNQSTGLNAIPLVGMKLGLEFVAFLLLMFWVKRIYYQNNITFKDAFTTGSLIGIFASLLLCVVVFVFIKYRPNASESLMHNSQEIKQHAIEKFGYVPADFDKKTNFELSPAKQALNRLSGIFFFLLFSLISATILKNKKPTEENIKS